MRRGAAPKQLKAGLSSALRGLRRSMRLEVPGGHLPFHPPPRRVQSTIDPQMLKPSRNRAGPIGLR